MRCYACGGDYIANSDEMHELKERITELKKQFEELAFTYDSLSEDYHDAQDQIANYEINWPKEKDLNRLKADAVRTWAKSYYISTAARGFIRAMQYADKIERGDV